MKLRPFCRVLSQLSLAALCALPLLGQAQSTAPAPAGAVAYDYQLEPQQVAEGVYVLIGRNEDFSSTNGGNIVNVGILIGERGVILIDSGPSRRYGEQLRATVARLTPLPIEMVIHTHHHPDHVLGSQVFSDSALAALPAVQRQWADEASTFLDNMYRLNGAWMQGTQVAELSHALSPGRHTLAGRELELIELGGHSDADLVIHDLASGVIFAGDLVFNQRAPTTPHANLPNWIAALDQLARRQPTTLVPGHGPISQDGLALTTTRGYLRWLDTTLREAAEQGLDAPELLAVPLPAEFAAQAEGANEFRRSVIQLYPAYERAALKPTRPAQL